MPGFIEFRLATRNSGNTEGSESVILGRRKEEVCPMATSPQPPRPPVSPPAPRTGSNVLAIVLLVLALIVVVSSLAVWAGLRYLSQSVRVQVEERGAGKKEVSIKTPIGSLEVHPEVSEARLGLPIYPGARALKEDGGATVNLDFANEESVRIVAGKFETSDSLEKVKAFYRSRLGAQVTKFIEKSPEGKTVFEIKTSQQEKVVALRSYGDGTRIELVRVSHGHEESN